MGFKPRSRTLFSLAFSTPSNPAVPFLTEDRIVCNTSSKTSLPVLDAFNIFHYVGAFLLDEFEVVILVGCVDDLGENGEQSGVNLKGPLSSKYATMLVGVNCGTAALTTAHFLGAVRRCRRSLERRRGMS